MMHKFKRKTLNEIADMICGNPPKEGECYFVYRSSSYLTEFFEDCELDDYVHGGSTRKWWVVGVLEEILTMPATNHHLLPDSFIVVLRVLMNQEGACNEEANRSNAMSLLNSSLRREGIEAFYDDKNICQIQNTETGDSLFSNINSSKGMEF